MKIAQYADDMDMKREKKSRMFKFKFYASFNGFYIWIDGDSNAQFTLKRETSAVTTIDEKMTKIWR